VLMKWRRWRQMRRRRVSTMSEGKKLTSQTAFSDGKGRRGLKTYKARRAPDLGKLSGLERGTAEPACVARAGYTSKRRSPFQTRGRSSERKGYG
jgi:hypothetical protein